MATDRASAIDTLAKMLHQTAEDHHVAFAATDGVDGWDVGADGVMGQSPSGRGLAGRGVVPGLARAAP